MKSLAIEPLSAAAFEPFGDVIETAGAEVRIINEGTTRRFHDLAAIDVAAEGGAPILSVFRAAARAQPIQIRMVESHPLASQAFFPLSQQDWLVVVCEDNGGEPALDTLRCFQATGWQGVNYARGVWHHPLLALAPSQDFLVVDRDGPGANLEERWFDHDPRVIEPV